MRNELTYVDGARLLPVRHGEVRAQAGRGHGGTLLLEGTMHSTDVREESGEEREGWANRAKRYSALLIFLWEIFTQ